MSIRDTVNLSVVSQTGEGKKRTAGGAKGRACAQSHRVLQKKENTKAKLACQQKKEESDLFTAAAEATREYAQSLTEINKKTTPWDVLELHKKNLRRLPVQ